MCRYITYKYPCIVDGCHICASEERIFTEICKTPNTGFCHPVAERIVTVDQSQQQSGGIDKPRNVNCWYHKLRAKNSCIYEHQLRAESLAKVSEAIAYRTASAQAGSRGRSRGPCSGHRFPARVILRKNRSQAANGHGNHSFGPSWAGAYHAPAAEKDKRWCDRLGHKCERRTDVAGLYGHYQ